MIRFKWTGMSLIVGLALGSVLAWAGTVPQRTLGREVGGGCNCMPKDDYSCSSVNDYCYSAVDRCAMDSESLLYAGKICKPPDSPDKCKVRSTAPDDAKRNCTAKVGENCL